MTRSARSARTLLARVLVPMLLLLALPAARGEAQGPIVEITPHGKLVTTTDRSFTVSIKWCMPWGGSYFATRWVTLGGTDVTSQFSQTGGGQDGTCDLYETWSATLTMPAFPFNQELFAYAQDYNSYAGTDAAMFAIPAAGRAVLVNAAAGFVNVKPSSANSHNFTVTNTGESTREYSLGVACHGAASGCSVSPSSFTLSSSESITVAASYTASATVGDTGMVKVTATDNADYPEISASGWMDVMVKAAPSAGVVIARALDNVSRGACVTASLGSDAAMECGDLRIVHPLPGVKTMGRGRVPTLLYNSQHARPMPVLLADVTLPSGTLPSAVNMIVMVDGVQRGYRSFSGSDWGAGGNTRRIAVDVDVTGLGTSLRDYYVIADLSPGAAYYSDTTRMAIVDRSQSAFGAGWWLAGLERLYDIVPNDRLLWVGGDGSTRVYSWNGTSYKAADFDRPDSITTSGTDFIRWGPAKLQVRFNASGQHISTTNRLGHVTTFLYVSGTNRLWRLSVPVASGSALTYEFAYDGNGVLQTVYVPNESVSRNVGLTALGPRIVSITDPGSAAVSFGYGAGSNADRIESRTDRRGYVTTFSYNAVNQLTQSSLNLGSGQSITTALRPVESYGIGVGAQSLDSVYTMIDGPRGDVADVTKIWVNQYGAPTRIRNAEGRETRLWYDAAWPGLVAESRSPSRLFTRALYNGDGTLQSTTAYNPLGTGANATTSYTWDPTWKFVTSITPPVGPVTEMSYSSSDGNREWEQTGGSARRVSYGYTSGLLASVTPPGIPATTYSYNSLGNVSEVTSPKGYKSFTLQNAIGQDTLVASAFGDTTVSGQTWGNIVSSGAANGTRARAAYDAMGRVTSSTSYGPAVGTEYPNGDSLRVEHIYDYEGNETSTTRKYTVGSNAWALQHTTTYDGAGRATYKTSPSDGKSFTYDPAGNVTSTTNGRGLTVTMTYDLLNRLKKRVVPQVTYSAIGCSSLLYFPFGCSWDFPTIGGTSLCINPDTAQFQYDPAGNLERADNRYARVSRAYTPNGLLAGEGLHIRTVKEPGDTPCGPAESDAIFGGAEWMAHNYGIGHTYDLAGRRIQSDGPYYVSGCLQSPCARPAS